MISAHDIIEEILADIIEEGAHFFTIYIGGFNYGYSSYSRNFGGGAFQGAFRYRYIENDMKFVLDAVHKPSRIIRKEFNLSNPNSFDLIKADIKGIINNMQSNRTLDNSKGGSIIFHSQENKFIKQRKTCWL